MSLDLWQQVIHTAVAIDQAAVSPRSRVLEDGQPASLLSVVLRNLSHLRASCGAERSGDAVVALGRLLEAVVVALGRVQRDADQQRKPQSRQRGRRA